MIEINNFYNEDCLETISKMGDVKVDCVITSPPYNINTSRSDCYYNNGYSELDGLSENDYLEVRTNEFKEFSRVINVIKPYIRPLHSSSSLRK